MMSLMTKNNILSFYCYGKNASDFTSASMSCRKHANTLASHSAQTRSLYYHCNTWPCVFASFSLSLSCEFIKPPAVRWRNVWRFRDELWPVLLDKHQALPLYDEVLQFFFYMKKKKIIHKSFSMSACLISIFLRAFGGQFHSHRRVLG